MTTVSGTVAVARALYSLYTKSAHEHVSPLRRREADVYLPEGELGASVVLVHGGGFVIGSRSMKPVRFLASHLARSGIAVCAIDYRLLFRGGGLVRSTEDVVAAIDWWRGESRSFSLDPDRVSIAGISAGATLALLAASGRPIHRAACIFGLYDFDDPNVPLGELLSKLLLETDDRTTWRARSPLRSTHTAAPLLLIHGSSDRLVPVVQAEALASARRSLGLKTSLQIYDGEPHSFLNWPGPAASRAASEVTAFLRGEPI
jgi:acetyl esterase